MKFQTILDVQTFLTEIGSFSKLTEKLEVNYVPTDEEEATFLKSRTAYVSKMKDYRKSANQKANWRENRSQMMRGIKAFHRSVEGKRYHRKLGRFLASRITRKTNESVGYPGFLEQLEFLQGLNSVKQHMYSEMEYFHQAQEQIELEEMILEYAIPMFRSIEAKIIESKELTEDEMIFVLDLTESQDFMLAVSDVTGKEPKSVNEVFQTQVDNLIKEGIAKEDKQFYPILVQRLSVFNWETL